MSRNSVQVGEDVLWARLDSRLAYGDMEQLFLSRRTLVDGRWHTQRAKIVWEDVEEGRFWTMDDALIQGPGGSVTALLLGALGQRAVTSQEMDAVKYHLEDMRKLALKQPERP